MSGWAMKRVSACASKLIVAGSCPVRSSSSVAPKVTRMPEREADRQRLQRAPGELGLAVDDRHAGPGDRPELGSDDHRRDDQDRLVEVDADRGDQHRQDHEHEKARRELDALVGARVELLPDDRVDAAHAALLLEVRGRRRDLASRSPRSRSSPPRRCRARAGRRSRRSRPRARRRRGARRPRAAWRRVPDRRGCRPSPCCRAARARSAPGSWGRRCEGEPSARSGQSYAGRKPPCTMLASG